MLANARIDSLVKHLEQFKLNEQKRQVELDNLLKDYSQLLGDYQALKNAFDQKGSRTPTGKQLIAAPTQTSPNPYVLVLVDGNGYIFNDELIREKEEGGMRAARMLNDSVEKYIQQSVPEARSSRIIVRIYADLTSLSKQLAKSKLTGMEKRSVASFSAAFTRAISLFDFVDALDEEGSKFKIREQFTLALEDSNCRHVLYAACHDTAYLSQLVPFSGMRDRITLVQAAGWITDFHQFNLNITQFPTVFRWSELPASAPAAKSILSNGSTVGKNKSAQKPAISPAYLQDSWRNNSIGGANSIFGASEMSPIDANGSVSNDGAWSSMSPTSPTGPQDLCKYFSKGFCRYGNKCTFQHVPTSLNLSGSAQLIPATTTADTPPASTTTATAKPNAVTLDRSNISANLPTTTVPGFISLNKDFQRLDPFVRHPTTNEWQIYNARFHKQKPCNAWHLQRTCTAFGCPYDHNELEEESRHVLEYVLRCTPCPKKSGCRKPGCYFGHICQKDNCIGQMKGCRLKADLHNVDPKLCSMVPAEDEPAQEDENGGFEMPNDGNLMW